MKRLTVEHLTFRR